MVNQKKIPSRVITFYSYKGGVGRSMAMANIGVLMAAWGYKVLLIDWDLEAPGLENYFCHHLNVQEVQNKKGLIDLLHLKAQCDEILVEEIPWQEYINKIVINNTISIDLLNAGKRDENYFIKVRQFDYTGFYKESDGGQYLENLREYWLEEYDFILIDSRTGLTDSSGICSIHMPDVLVLLFTPNEQSFNGIKEVAKKATEGQKQIMYDRFRLRVLPIPSRIENAETQLLDEWMGKIYRESADMLEWLPKKESNTEEFSITPDQVIGQLKIPYKTFYAYGERLSVIERGTLDPHDLGYVYENIAAVLANDLQNIHLLTDARDLLIKKAKGEEVIDYSDLERKYAEEQDAKVRLQEELKKKESLIEQKTVQSKKKKSTFIWVAVVLGLLIAAIFYAVGSINTNSGTDKPAGDTTAIAGDSDRDKAANFATQYSTSNQQAELGFNLAMAQKYYELDAAYQDTFKNIKDKIEFAVSYRFQELADSFYFLLRKDPSSLSGLLNDTLYQFGSLKNMTAKNIISRLNSIVKPAGISNTPVDTSFDLVLDKGGFKATYTVNGNSLIGSYRKYKTVKTTDVLLFDQDLKLTAYNYQVLDSQAVAVAVAKTTVELLICNSVSKMDYSNFNAIAGMLRNDKNFIVSSNANFTSSRDVGSPYYFTAPVIKYSDEALRSRASQVQQAIRKVSGYTVPLKLQRSSRKNYISAYLCSEKAVDPKMDVRQQKLPDNRKKY
jgi:MinD-like ATPase involved in chromosome partitioning or flagellar assembly/flagellar basal body-associated protein FliL